MVTNPLDRVSMGDRHDSLVNNSRIIHRLLNIINILQSLSFVSQQFTSHSNYLCIIGDLSHDLHDIQHMLNFGCGRNKGINAEVMATRRSGASGDDHDCGTNVTPLNRRHIGHGILRRGTFDHGSNATISSHPLRTPLIPNESHSSF
jgi:hypothetical protein